MKAFVPEDGSDLVRSLLEDSPCGTCSIALVECRATFARLRREGYAIRSEELRMAKELDQRWRRLLAIAIDEQLLQEAGELTDRHPLRAGDALHLASAARIAALTPSQIPFACWDGRLWDAARAEGFAMVPAERP